MLIEQDIKDLALCAYMEDRTGVGFGLGIMCVVMNRVKSPNFPNTVHDVIFQKNQFSWTRLDDPQYGTVPHGPIYEALLNLAPLVLSGETDDPTDGALYYANEKHITPNGWYKKNIIDRPDLHPVTVIIGQHTFRR